ncbi:MAG: diaminopimelate epimerase, partial [Lachnospiraceae bacterium]|nr:diaminopimelate epimerase [Lachnospiraceae bacterium]
GLILIKPSEKADFTMEMYNADGSQGEMCGNAIRCVGKYVYDHGMTEKTELSIETLAGIKYLQLSVKGLERSGEAGAAAAGEGRGSVYEVTVDMGIPGLRPAEIPVEAAGDRVIDEPVTVGGREYRMTAVSMGNPHAVIFVDDTRLFPVGEVGPLFENHPRFPERVNTEFVQIIDRSTINMRVWERGSAETWACGTGACASVMASILNGRTDDEVTVHMLGGDLRIRYDRSSGRVFMTGPAVTVFEGETKSF